MWRKINAYLAGSAAGILLAAAIILLWHAISAFGIFDSFLFPSPVAVLQRLGELVFGMEILPDISSTLAKIGIAIIAGSVGGTAAGMLLSRWGAVYASVSPLMDFFRSIPATALFPLFLLVFGIGDPTNIALATWICALYLSLHVSKGLRSTSETSLLIAKSLKKSELEIFAKVRLMEALPVIFVGLRTAVSLSVVVVIVTEMFIGTQHGLGKALIDAAYVYDMPKLYAVLLIVGIIGWLLNQMVEFAELKIVHWQGK